MGLSRITLVSFGNLRPPTSPTRTNIIYGQVLWQIVINFGVHEIFIKVHLCYFELNYGYIVICKLKIWRWLMSFINLIN